MPYDDKLSEGPLPASPAITPTSISTLRKVRDVKLSPSGSHVLYQVIDFYKPEPPEEVESELWVADISEGEETRSRFLTYGTAGVWDPSGQRIFFFAAGSGKGNRKEVRVIEVVEHAEPKALESLSLHNVQSLAISPDGMFIAFLGSTPAPRVESDVKVYSSPTETAGVSTSKLYILPCPHGSFTAEELPMELTPDSSFPRNYAYIESFAWAPDSESIVYRVRKERGIEYAYKEAILKRVYLPVHLTSRFPRTTSITTEIPPPPPPTPMNGALINPMEDVAPPKVATVTRTLKVYPRSPSGGTILLSSGYVVDLQSYNLDRVLDARTVYLSPLFDLQEKRGAGHSDGNTLSVPTRLYGETEDAVRVVDAFPPFPGNCESAVVPADTFPFSIIAVEVATRTETHIDAVFLATSGDGTAPITVRIFETGPEEAIWFNAWDARVRLLEPDSARQGGKEFESIVGVVLSSVMRHEPPNVWVVRTHWHWSPSHAEPDGSSGSGPTLTMLSTSRRKVSEHLGWLVEAPKITGEVFRWTHTVGNVREGEGDTSEEVELDGIVRFPPGYSKETSGRLPTILFIHGGPYRRDIPDYMSYFSNWRELLASNEYIVLSPNYRGSQGRGHASRPAHLNEAWEDCLSMIREAVERGISDPERLGVAGWSHGGSLVAWGITRPYNAHDIKFKAAIVGAGVADWNAMIWGTGASVGMGGGGSPELEAAICGMNPWTLPVQPTPNGNGMAQASLEGILPARNHGKNLSPMSLVSHVNPYTALLILHGEKDERVPVGQAVGLYRGAVRAGKRVQLILYPREGHGFTERKHVKDVCERVLKHFERWL